LSDDVASLKSELEFREKESSDLNVNFGGVREELEDELQARSDELARTRKELDDMTTMAHGLSAEVVSLRETNTVLSEYQQNLQRLQYENQNQQEKAVSSTEKLRSLQRELLSAKQELRKASSALAKKNQEFDLVVLESNSLRGTIDALRNNLDGKAELVLRVRADAVRDEQEARQHIRRLEGQLEAARNASSASRASNDLLRLEIESLSAALNKSGHGGSSSELFSGIREENRRLQLERDLLELKLWASESDARQLLKMYFHTQKYLDEARERLRHNDEIQQASGASSGSAIDLPTQLREALEYADSSKSEIETLQGAQPQAGIQTPKQEG